MDTFTTVTRAQRPQYMNDKYTHCLRPPSFTNLYFRINIDQASKHHRNASLRMARPRSKAPPPLKFDTCATRLKADSSRLSLLLDLIPELRNAIYEYVFASTGGVLLSRHAINRAIAPRESALLYVNKQVHTEFLHAAWLLADIHTTSLDYDFRHVVTFLNRHNDEEIRALPSKLFPRHRAIVVEIEPGSYGDGMPQCLERWLNRFGHPTKEGAQVHFEHRLRPGYKSDRKASSECWRVYMEMIPGRRLEEFKSIIAAVR